MVKRDFSLSLVLEQLLVVPEDGESGLWDTEVIESVPSLLRMPKNNSFIPIPYKYVSSKNSKRYCKETLTVIAVQSLAQYHTSQPSSQIHTTLLTHTICPTKTFIGAFQGWQHQKRELHLK